MECSSVVPTGPWGGLCHGKHWLAVCQLDKGDGWGCGLSLTGLHMKDMLKVRWLLCLEISPERGSRSRISKKTS